MTVPAGATPIPGAKGVYDLDGVMHLDIDELLADQGIANTPENRRAIEKATRDCFDQLGIPVSEG